MKSLFIKRTLQCSSLVDELNETKSRLEAAQNRYAYLTDPDMIESSILEMGALRARYRQILKELKSGTAGNGEKAV